MTTRYLSRKELAERIGVAPSALSRYRLPDADALVGAVRGWLPETVDNWHDRRPGHGARTDISPSAAARRMARGVRGVRSGYGVIVNITTGVAGTAVFTEGQYPELGDDEAMYWHRSGRAATVESCREWLADKTALNEIYLNSDSDY